MQKSKHIFNGLFASVLALVLASSGSVYAKENEAKGKVKPLLNKAVSAKQKIRFYKANKQLQATSILLTDEKSASAGCQNFLKKVRVYKAVQIGFSSCTLYAEKDCPITSSVVASSEDQAHATTLLSEGVGWFPDGDSDRGATVGSWSCDQSLDGAQIAYETRHARRELVRLNIEARDKEIEAAEARAKADQAKKEAAKARKYATRVKAYAIATGAIEPDPEKDEDDQGKGGKGKPSKDKKKPAD